jgi:hypothetical protein
MLADLAADPQFEIRGLTRFALYGHFIDHLIEREATKKGRGDTLKRDDRRTFAGDLAWHLWTSTGSYSLGCRVDELPDSLFEPYDLATDSDFAVKRALISGSFLDEKAGGVFFYAHRSFQEFLVAEYIWNHLEAGTEKGADILQNLPNALTGEVFDFLIERGDTDFFRGLIKALNQQLTGVPTETFLTLIRSEALRTIASARNAATISTWDAGIMMATPMLEWTTKPEAILETAKIIALRASKRPSVILAALKTLLLIGPRLDIPVDLLAPASVALLFARSEEDIEALARQQVRSNRADPIRDSIFACVSAEQLLDGRLMMSLDVNELLKDAVEATHQPIDVGFDLLPLGSRLYRASFNEFFRPVSRQSHQYLLKFFRQDAEIAGGMEGPRRDELDSQE